MVDAAQIAPEPVTDGPLPTCKGYQQLDSTALASAAGLTVPNGTTLAYLQAESVNIRWRADADPTAAVGMLLASGETIIYAASRTAIAALRFIRIAPGSILNVTYY